MFIKLCFVLVLLLPISMHINAQITPPKCSQVDYPCSKNKQCCSNTCRIPQKQFQGNCNCSPANAVCVTNMDCCNATPKLTCQTYVCKASEASSNSELTLQNDAELKAARAKYLGTERRSGWVLLQYVDRNTLKFLKGGKTTSGLRENLGDSSIQYALLRIPVKNNEVRDIFVEWIGPDVTEKTIKRKSNSLSRAKSFLEPFDVAIKVYTKDPERFNNAKIRAVSGPDSETREICDA